MNELDWHLDDAMVRRYGDGDLSFAAAASVDAHLPHCAQCQDLVAAAWAPPGLESAKAALDATLDAPPVSLLERVLQRAGLGVLDTKVIASSLALQGSWVVAALLASAFALVAAGSSGGTAGAVAFLVLSPLVPLAGVGLAFGPQVDPTYEVSMAAPVPAARIVLLRTAAVAASTLPALMVVSAFLPALPTSPLVWALPALGLAAASLALGTVIPIGRAALLVGGTWMLAAAIRLSGASGAADFLSSFPAFRPPGQLLFAAVTAAGIVMVAGRQEHFEVAR